MSVLATLGFVAVAGAVGTLYLSQRLYRCPDCGHRSDYDHVAEVTENRPYCPYCGTQTDYIGQKWEAWKARLTGGALTPRRKAGEGR